MQNTASNANIFLFHPFHQNFSSCLLLSFFFPPELSFTFFDPMISQTELNQTLSERKKKKMGENEIPLFDHRLDSR